MAGWTDCDRTERRWRWWGKRRPGDRCPRFDSRPAVSVPESRVTDGTCWSGRWRHCLRNDRRHLQQTRSITTNNIREREKERKREREKERKREREEISSFNHVLIFLYRYTTTMPNDCISSLVSHFRSVKSSSFFHFWSYFVIRLHGITLLLWIIYWRCITAYHL